MRLSRGRGVFRAADFAVIRVTAVCDAVTRPFAPIQYNSCFGATNIGYHVREAENSIMRAIVPLAVAMLAAVGSGQTPRPLGTYKGLDLCNYARVKRMQSPGHVILRSGPGLAFPKTDQLASGAVVYTCDYQGEWFKLFYSAPDGPCGSVLPQGISSDKVQGCKWGWARRKWIEVLSG
jgi:hypothetical protein